MRVRWSIERDAGIYVEGEFTDRDQAVRKLEAVVDTLIRCGARITDAFGRKVDSQGRVVSVDAIIPVLGGTTCVDIVEVDTGRPRGRGRGRGRARR